MLYLQILSPMLFTVTCLLRVIYYYQLIMHYSIATSLIGMHYHYLSDTDKLLLSGYVTCLLGASCCCMSVDFQNSHIFPPINICIILQA